VLCEGDCLSGSSFKGAEDLLSAVDEVVRAIKQCIFNDVSSKSMRRLE
jgi:hypothetical protein